MTEPIVLRGWQELNERIKELGPAGKKAARRALARGARTLQTDISALAPLGQTKKQAKVDQKKRLKSYHLKQNILTRLRETTQGIAASVGVRKDIFWGWFVERGTQPHYLGKGSNQSVIGGRHGRGWWRYRGIKHTLAERRTGKMHPGAKAKKFVEPAWVNNKEGIMASIREELSRELFK